MMKKMILLPLLAALLPLALQAAEKPEEWRKYAEQAVVKAFPDAPTVLLWDDLKMTYQPDGTSVTLDDYYEKVMNELGRSRMRELRFPFHSVYEKFELLQLELIKADGRRMPVDFIRTGKVSIDAEQMSANIFDPSMRVYSVPLADLQLGDTIHITTRSRTVKPRMPGQWNDIVLLQAESPVLKYLVTVDAPASRPLGKWMVKDPVPGTVRHSEERSGSRILYRWVAEKVPPIVPEPNMPSLVCCAQRLLLSTAKDWSEIASWYDALCAPRIAATGTALPAKVRELTAKIRTDEEKVRALFQFVSQQIHYTGITAEKDAPGYEPHDVSATFGRRHGVCRDKAALLAAMLRLAGFKAYPVLFMAGDPKDDEVPNNYFNHAITAWEKSPGVYQLMDPTFESTAELFPSVLSNQSFLVAKPGEKLRRSPVVPPERNALVIRTDAALDPSGTLSGTCTMEFQGVNDTLYRSAFSRWTPQYRRQAFASLLQKALPGAELTRLVVTPEKIRDTKTPLRVEFAFRAGSWVAMRGGSQLLGVPEFGGFFGVVNYLLAEAKLEKRKFVYRPDAACQVRESWRLALPPSLKVTALPGVLESRGKALTRLRKMERGADRLSGENLISLNSVEITPDQYRELKDILRQSTSAAGSLPVAAFSLEGLPAQQARKACPEADSLLISSHTTVELSDPHTWRSTEHVRRRILNYAGVKKHSQLLFAHNPVWETVTVSAVVHNGTRSTPVDEKEINVMDAPWAGEAPRYPAGKVVAVSLPDVVPGSEIEYTVTRRLRDRPFFAVSAPFAGREPIREKSLQVLIPAGLPFHAAPARLNMTRTDVKNERGTSVTFHSENVMGIPAEPGQPPLEDFVPMAQLSCGNLTTYGKELSAALERVLARPAPKTEALAKKLGPDLHRIREFVAREIRPAGPAMNELPRRYLFAPDVTLTSGYGNSADRALLLMRLLRFYKVPARFIAISRKPYFPALRLRQEAFPVDDFTGLLIYLPGERQYWNDTDEYAIPGAVGHEGCLGLDLDSCRLLMVRPEHRFVSRKQLICRIDLQKSGNAKIRMEELLYGNDYGKERTRFARMTPERRKQHFESCAAAYSQAAVVQGVPETDFSHYPGVIRFTMEVPHFAVSAGKYLSLELPGFRNCMDLALGGGGRETPFRRAAAKTVETEYLVYLPDELEPVRTREEKTECSGGKSVQYRERAHFAPDRVEIRSKLVAAAGDVSPAEFEEQRRLQKQMCHPSGCRILLKKTDAAGKGKEKK